MNLRFFKFRLLYFQSHLSSDTTNEVPHILFLYTPVFTTFSSEIDFCKICSENILNEFIFSFCR